MKLMQFFDKKVGTPRYAHFSPAKSLYSWKVHHNISNLKKAHITYFKPKKGTRISPSILYLRTDLGAPR